MKTARAWKAFYEEERASLGETGLAALFDRASSIALPADGALVFPHVKLVDGGAMVAAVARAVVRSRCEDVLAIGVLHGAREEDAPLVAEARAGDGEARALLRRVHDESSPFVREEFSLDGFRALLAVAARLEGCRPPQIHARFPFLVGDDPSSLPGLDELRSLRERGAALVATTDPIHHGIGYGTPEGAARAGDDVATRSFGRSTIEAEFQALRDRRWADFQSLAADVRSDFRDAGPTLAMLLDGDRWRAEIVEVALSDYAAPLGAPPPTWVAAALVALDRDA